MNLVKVQELAKELSIPELQKYANGSSPEIMPAYIALGALQAKEAMQKKMAAMQGAAQGDQPSVKEQVEQKAGLMALQDQQQKQAQQAPPPPGGPVPAGTPQPEPQPEAPQEQVMMAASGGLARLPVDFNFRQGGIIGYAGPEGSVVGKKPPDAAAEEAIQEAKRTGDRDAMLMTLKKLGAAGYDVATLIPRAFMGVTEDIANTRLGRALGVDFKIPKEAYGGDRASMTPMMDRVLREKEAAPAPPTAQESASKPMAPADMAMRQAPAQGLPAAMPTASPAAPKPTQQMQPPAQRPAPQAPQPAQPAQGPIDQAQLIREEAERRKAFGIDKEIGAGAESRMSEQRKRFEEGKPSGLDDLIRVFGQAGQYKGLSGTGPAYTANQDRKRAEQAAFESQQDQMRTDIEEKRRGESVTRATGIGAGLATAREQQRQADEAKARNLTSIEVANIQAASQNRPGETERMFERYARLKATDPKAAAEYMATIMQIKSGAAADKTDLAALKILQKSYQDQLSPLGGADAATRKNAQTQLDAVNKQIAEIGGVAGGPSVDKPRLKFDAAGNPIK